MEHRALIEADRRNIGSLMPSLCKGGREGAAAPGGLTVQGDKAVPLRRIASTLGEGKRVRSNR